MKRKKGLFTEARFLAFRTLYFDTSGVSLREIAYRSGMSLRGVQVATSSLLAIGLIKKKKVKQRVIFNINPTHFEYLAVEAMIMALGVAEITRCAVEDSKRNANTLAALDDLRNFSSKIKEGHK